MAHTGSSGTMYQLESSRLAGGGEGDVFRVISRTSKKVAKIYHSNKLSQELENKLQYMVNNPPDPSVLNQVAWPLDVLYDTNNKFCGFVMPELSINAQLKDIYQYPPTARLSARQKVIIAENICAVISAVHSAGYVFGDFNPCNIGVDKSSGKVAFLDTDSYHVFDRAKNRHYRCKVCVDGYAAPELLEVCANHAATHPNDSKQLYEKTPLPTFTKETDNFALAIHIFKLLMNGFTPFGGIIETTTPSQASPSMGNKAIRRNEYSFRPGYKPLSPAVPPLDIFPQEIADLFTRAFLVVGPINPSQRPTSIEWHQALSWYEATLVDCPSNGLHQYDRKNKSCPFCEADIRYQQSISGQKVQAPTPISTPISLLQQKTYSQARSGSVSQTPSGTYGGGSGNTTPPVKRIPVAAIILGGIGLVIGMVIMGTVRAQPSVTVPAETIATQPVQPSPAPAPTPAQPTPAPPTQTQPAVPPQRPIPDGFVRINGGTFTMGSPANEPGHHRIEDPQRQVTVNPFYMGKHEVTQWEYEEMMGTNPSVTKGTNLPVNNVSWFDAIEYCNRRSQREGLSPAYTISGIGDSRLVTWNRNANGYRLPTEAEWEYACRAGTTTPYNTGSTITERQAYFGGGWGSSTEVGSFAPNPWGLYDMHGNVWEWCWDWFGSYPSGAQTNPVGASSSSARVIRGGDRYSDETVYLRSAQRFYGNPSGLGYGWDTTWSHGRNVNVGFRLVRN